MTLVYSNVEDIDDDWRPDEEDTFQYASLQDYFEGYLALHWNLGKNSGTRMTYLIINTYQLLMSINTYANIFFVLHEVLNMTYIIVCTGVSAPPQNLLNMEAVHHDPPPKNFGFFRTPIMIQFCTPVAFFKSY